MCVFVAIRWNGLIAWPVADPPSVAGSAEVRVPRMPQLRVSHRFSDK